nr:helix-turn-helix transcriptional regulator [uncultured Desulfobacter sp.]
MLSNFQKAKIFDALNELYQTINYTSDFSDFFQILESVIKTLFPVDWMGIYTINQSGDAYNVVTNPSVPFDWNEKYGEILPYDEFRIQTAREPVGGACIFSFEDYLVSDEGSYCYEVIKKYTDTSHFLALHTIKTNTVDSGIAFYRIDEHFEFTENDRELIVSLSPFLVSMSNTLRLYTESDLKRITLETFCRCKKNLYLCLDDTLNPIDLPQETQIFFKRNFTRGVWKNIPEEIWFWIKKVVAPMGNVIPGSGPWKTRCTLDEMELVITAHAVITEHQKTVLVLFLKPHGNKQDFNILVKDGLTPKEIETLSYLPLGYSNRQIAQAMTIAEVTVKKHLKNASKKLNAYGKTETLFNAITRKTFLEEIID